MFFSKKISPPRTHHQESRIGGTWIRWWWTFSKLFLFQWLGLLKRHHLLCFTSNLSSAIQRGLFSYLCWWWGTLPALVDNDWWRKVERADTGWRLEIINLITSNLHPVPALPSKHNHQLLPNRAGNGEWIVIMIASSIFLLIFKNNDNVDLLFCYLHDLIFTRRCIFSFRNIVFTWNYPV